ncbi:SGNH/GDSL hydrolase family protein [Actinoplanes bogorensis]|uniref:SGNH/GDSL hydrolase family protein n=1 Tax=Paractinoplanes bogorensis TaxID=1610840 RepID=A0ABS5Z1R9_9ACTN|nr:SGNH/GDSL hydrolase family protein [Actinoplanes bogorensis]MBU2669635.1 SGNH/GDSL hydrolase family protein [Actinoplanes bogorensis]
MIRFASLGDSVTSGYGDPMPGGNWRGWAALLAEALPPDTDFHNLAVSGARAADVAERQLPAALELRPHLASVLVGMNDTLRGDFDADILARRLGDVVAALTACGATVLTARLPDPGRMFNLPGVIARPLGRRMEALNTALDEIARRHATIHVDLAGGTSYDKTHWSVDRLHPSEVGHRYLAHRFASALRDAGHPVHTLPGLAATNPLPTLSARVWWMATKGNQWLLRRSTDLLPSLAQMAAREWLAPGRESMPGPSIAGVPGPVPQPPQTR